MTELFTIPIERVMYGVLVLLATSLSVLALVAWRHPVLVRMGLRNIARRPAQTTLIIFGLMLSTLIMSAAFATGDTVSYSIAGAVFDGLQGTDIVLGYDPRLGGGASGSLTDRDVEAVRAGLGANADIDGVTGSIDVGTPAIVRARRLSEPRARLVGLEPASSAAFGLTHVGNTVVPVDALQPGEAYATRSLASSVDAHEGDVVTVYFDGTPHDLRVARVIDDFGVSGLGPVTGDAKLVTTLATARELAGFTNEVDSISISVRGGVRDSVERSEAVERAVGDYLAGGSVPAAVNFSKRSLVNIANLVGSVFVSFFVLFGLFSIAAGIMLIFLIFVMLAAERRSEMGIARAVGMRRLHVTEAFLAEGMTYNVGAAAVGSAAGVGVAYLLILALRSIFRGEAGLAITFHVNTPGVVIAYGLGVVLTFATVTYASWRASNLNIVRAIRDLPEPSPFHSERPNPWRLLLAGLSALIAVAWLGLGALWVTAAIALFIASLSFYGIGVVLGLPLAGWFAIAVAAAGRPFVRTRGWRRALYLGWWVVFFPLSLVVFTMVRLRHWGARHASGGGWALLMLVGGLASIYVGGWVWGQAFAYQTGHTLTLLAVAMLAVYFGAPARPAFTLAGLGLVWYWLLPLPFSLLLEDGAGWRDPLRGVLAAVGGPTPLPISASVEMFFFAGVSITTAATIVVVFNAGWFLGVVSLLGKVAGGLAPAVRTAIAYPLAAKFRTGMTLAMFTLVVFSLVVMASLSYNFTQLFLGDNASAGFDVLVRANANNPIEDLRADVRAVDPSALANIEGVGQLVTVRGEALEPSAGGDFRGAVLTGVDDEFLRVAPLAMSTRARGYSSDRAVLEALRTDPTTAVIDASYAGQRRGPGGPPAGGPAGGGPQAGGPRGPGGGPGGGGPGGGRFALSSSEAKLKDGPWDPIPLAIRDRRSGAVREVRVIGVLAAGQAGLLEGLAAVITARDNVASISPSGGERTILLQTRGRDATALGVARAVESALLERGVEATSIHESIRDASRQARSFQFLFEGFMGLGLIVGIAALGVIAFRTVVERRQQIGMLRAIGYTRRLVALSFFLESSFIAATGIGMGILLGVALSYNLLTSPALAAAAQIQFQVPWERLILIAGVAYGASALMTLLPARAASRVPVAAALRYE